MSKRYEPVCNFLDEEGDKYFGNVLGECVYKKHFEYFNGFYSAREIFEFFDRNFDKEISMVEKISYCYKLINFVVELDSFKLNDFPLFNCYREILNFCLDIFNNKFDMNRYKFIKGFFKMRKYLDFRVEFAIDDSTLFAADSNNTWHSIYSFLNYFKLHSEGEKSKVYVLFLGKESIIPALDLINMIKEDFRENLDFDVINFSAYVKGKNEIVISDILKDKIVELHKEGFEILIFQEDVYSGDYFINFLDFLQRDELLGENFFPLGCSNVSNKDFSNNKVLDQILKHCFISYD